MRAVKDRSVGKLLNDLETQALLGKIWGKTNANILNLDENPYY
jgi:hypothetical protein